MNTLQSLYVAPADDNDMIYDKTIHRWKLSKVAIQSAEPHISDEVATKKAASISQHVYTYIRHMAVIGSNFPFAEWVYSCTKQGKEMIKEAMMDQLFADAESNLDGTANQARINFVTGSVVDREAARNARVDEDAKDLIDDFCLDFNGVPYQLSKRFFLGITMTDDRYEVWGY